MERKLGATPQGKDKEDYYLGVALQTILVTYVICSFFASIQYLWYLYYPAAYAIGLCRIRELEKVAGDESMALVPVQSSGHKTSGGVLWKPRRFGEGALWQLASGWPQRIRERKNRLRGRAKV